MVNPKGRPQRGDIFEVVIPAGRAYIQFVARHPEYGEAVLIGTHVHAHRPKEFGATFSNGYMTFYPLTVALSKGFVTRVGNLPPPSLAERWRRPGAMTGKKVETWVIEDGSGKTVEVKEVLSERERSFPLASIWGHEMLVTRLQQSWRPEFAVASVGDDRLAAAAHGPPTQSSTDSALVHYLYVPTEAAAAEVSEKLSRRRYKTTYRLGADGKNWLVLAEATETPSGEESEEVRSFMSQLAAENGGEYDGWEAATGE